MRLVWLLRMSQWARNPPSARRIKIVAASLAVALAILGLEYFGLWPEALTAQRMRP